MAVPVVGLGALVHGKKFHLKVQKLVQTEAKPCGEQRIPEAFDVVDSELGNAITLGIHLYHLN